MIDRARFNYFLYRSARKMLNGSRGLVPGPLVPHLRYLGSELTIGITTYHERYEKLFRPLFKRLRAWFPEVSLLIAANGNHDQALQQTYLKRLEQELGPHMGADGYFLLHDRPVGLAMMWNEILRLSPTSTTLILNDDLCLTPWFRRWVERIPWNQIDLCFINSTWSHFAISRALITMVGAFDTAFSGIGFEDMDYDARVHLAGMKPFSILCPFIRHLDHQPQRTSFDDVSGRTWGKYTTANEAYFHSKWQPSNASCDPWIRQLANRVKPRNELPPPLPLQPVLGARHGCFIYPDRSSAEVVI